MTILLLAGIYGGLLSIIVMMYLYSWMIKKFGLNKRNINV